MGEGAVLGHFRRADDAVHPAIEFVRAYWERKRGPRAMPSRADMSPSELREYLGYICLIDVLPNVDDYRYRLVGTLVTQFFLGEGTGKTVRESFTRKTPPEAREAVLKAFRKAVHEKRPIFRRAPRAVLGWNNEPFQAILLPLSEDGENVNLLIQAFAFDRNEVLMAREIHRAKRGISSRLPG